MGTARPWKTTDVPSALSQTELRSVHKALLEARVGAESNGMSMLVYFIDMAIAEANATRLPQDTSPQSSEGPKIFELAPSRPKAALRVR